MKTPVHIRTELDALLCDEFGGRVEPSRKNARFVSYKVPNPLDTAGRYFLVEATLNPVWCWFSVDRIATTDRREGAGPWFEKVVWPVLRDRLATSPRLRGWYTWPTGGKVFTSVTCLHVGDFMSVVEPWIRLELGEWNVSREEQHARRGAR